MLPDNIIGWLVVGLIAGALGKLIMPGRDPGGLIVTIILGVLGALLTYYLAPMVGLASVRDNPSWTNTILASTVGALILLILYRLVARRR